MIAERALEEFLQHHRLPASYAQVIYNYASPIATAIVEKRQSLNRPLLIGVNGCQGSGKTTLSDALVMLLTHQHNLKAAAVSIDDFYKTKAERQKLASDVHPLLLTRGVPGTHDIPLAKQTLDQLLNSQNSVAIPRFDKSTDDRCAEHQWDTHQAPMDVVILEGWCVGALPQPLADLENPVNALEAQGDNQGSWRHYVNAQLQLDYVQLWQGFDVQVMLKAPSFNCVFNWRKEQEDKLREKMGGQGAGLMSDAEVERFIQHYQRITEYNLKALPEKVNFLLNLDSQRSITDFVMPLAI